MKQSPSWLVAFLCVLGAVLIWSTSFVATKIALQGFPPFTLAILRLVIATIVMGSVAVARKCFIVPTLPDLLRLTAGGFVGLTLYFCFENYGIKLTSASDAVLLVSFFPIITMLLDTALFKTHLSMRRIAGAFVAIVGVYLIVSNATMVSGRQRLLGDILMILSGVTWALYNFLTKSLVKKYSMFTVNFYQNATATICFLPFVLLERGEWTTVTTAMPAFKALLYLGIVCSIVASMLYIHGLRGLDPASAVSIMNLMPLFGVVFSAVVLHESVTILQAAGGAVVLIGVSLSLKREANESLKLASIAAEK